VSDKKNWIWPNLSGGCAVGSYFLLKAAKEKGIQATFMVGAGHCWLESEGYIYDITASQFTNSLVCDMCDAAMDQAVKVRVVSLSDIPYFAPGKLMPQKDHYSLPRHMYGMNRYQTRGFFFNTSEDNIAHINTNYPQGQRVRGYHMERLSNDKVRIFWRGNNKTIG
jgi:hypothetical protein